MEESKHTIVIIVTYNGMQWIEKCLQSIPDAYTVCIVDNGSSDGTIAYIQTHFSQHALLVQSQNLGFGQANNLGMRWALQQGATAVFLLNQDAYLEPDTLTILEGMATQYPEYGILSPVHYNGKGDTLDRAFSNYLRYDRQPHFYRDALQNALKDVYEVPFVNAAAWYLPKTTLDTIGGFDPIFFHYGEDDNYIQRARFHDLKVGVVPKATVYHDREMRKHIKPKPFSEKYFKNAEKMYKVTLANIGRDDVDIQIKNYSEGLQKSAFKSSMRLQLQRAKGYLKERKLLKAWVIAIKESRSKNQKTGAHYL